MVQRLNGGKKIPKPTNKQTCRRLDYESDLLLCTKDCFFLTCTQTSHTHTHTPDISDDVEAGNRNIVKFVGKANVFITFGNINTLNDRITQIHKQPESMDVDTLNN